MFFMQKKYFKFKCDKEEIINDEIIIEFFL